MKKKTIEEHQEYLHEMVKLKLFFLWHWLQDRPEESLSKILRERIDIYRKTSVNTELLNPKNLRFDSPEWLELENQLIDLWKKYDGNEVEFEKQGFEVFRKTIDARVEKDFRDKSGLDGYQCGSLRYNEHDAGSKQEFADFHIANAVAPKSIFDDPKYLPECFMELMKQTKDKYKSSKLRTSTWLNSYKKWLALFPKEWQDNLSEEKTDVKWHYGFWGQFISARGTFNHKVAEYLRENKKLLFYPRASYCSFKNMKKHLAGNFL